MRRISLLTTVTSTHRDNDIIIYHIYFGPCVTHKPGCERDTVTHLVSIGAGGMTTNRRPVMSRRFNEATSARPSPCAAEATETATGRLYRQTHLFRGVYLVIYVSYVLNYVATAHRKANMTVRPAVLAISGSSAVTLSS